MNLPANLPAIASPGSATRADRAAQNDAGPMKFDDMLEKKPGKGAQGTADEHADSRKTTWSWTRIELAKNRMELSGGTDAAAVDPSPSEGADAEKIHASSEDTDDTSTEGWTGQTQEGGQLWPDGEPVGATADEVATGGHNDQPPATEGPDRVVDERDLGAAHAGGRLAASDEQRQLPVQGDGGSRQGAAMAAGEDRRLDPRLAARERSSSISDRARGAERGEPMMREANRPAPMDGERPSQRPGVEGDVRTTEPRSAILSRVDGQKREDLLRADPFAQRVRVVASQSTPFAPPAPALASLGLSNASAQVVAAIREDVGEASRAAVASIEAQETAGARNRPVHTLQIQLQPADLGRVNARMSIDGSQLRVELQVETEQARASLTKDADSILKALKAAGFEIERVTVQQAQPASNTAQAGTQERGAGSFVAQDGGADESGSQGNQRGAGNHAGHGPQEGQDGASQGDTRGGLFI